MPVNHHVINTNTSPTRNDSPTSTMTDSSSDGEHEQPPSIGPTAATFAQQSPTPNSFITPSSSHGSRPRDSHMYSPLSISYSGIKQEAATAPSRRASLRLSGVTWPTTFIPSQRDRLRYSWQTIADNDEGTKPRIHVIKIVSTAFTASAGIGQEEAFGFSISTGGKRIAVYNSARLFILQTAALPVDVSQEFALKRKPLAVEVLDETSTLAVLADEHTINIYDFSHQTCRRTKTLRLDHPTSTIALYRTGALVAAAYEGGVEVFSLAPDALATDRRSVRCLRMDKLTFSDDGSTLLGTTTRLHASSTVIVSVPVFPVAENGMPSHEELKDAWCGGLLSPENIRNSSHATFWRERGSLCNEEVFAWNGLEETFGIMHTPDLEYSHLTCPIGVSEPLAAVGGLGAAIHSVPSVDEHGRAVGMIVNDRTVRIYTIPQDVSEHDSKAEAHSLDHELTDEYGCPFSDLRWVHSHKSIAPPIDSGAMVRGRLIVTSPGGVIDPELGPHGFQDVEGGRIIIFDFDPQYSGQPGQMFTFTLGKAPAQALQEETLDVATEVDLVRRRTVTQKGRGTLSQRPPSLGRSATTSRGKGHVLRAQANGSPTEQPSPLRTMSSQDNFSRRNPGRFRGMQHGSSSRSLLSLSPEASHSVPDLIEPTEGAYEQPYTQGAPRSTSSMQRAATNSNRHRFQTIEERVEQRTNPEGLPLPVYSEHANQTLPAKFRKLAGLDIPASGRVVTDSEVASAPAAVVATNAFPFPSPDQSAPVSSLSSSSTAQNPRDRNGTHLSVSPIGAPPASIGDWDNVSPLPPQMRANREHRHRTSWETMTTEQLNATSPPSQHVPSPSLHTRTFSDGQSRHSFDSSRPVSPPASWQHRPIARSASNESPNFSRLHGVAATQEDVPNHLGMEISQSTLQPFGQAPSPSPSQPRLDQIIDIGSGHPGMYDRTLSDRRTPFERVNEAAAAARKALDANAAPTENGVSAGSLPHPVLHWSPPGSPAVTPSTPTMSATKPLSLPRRGGGSTLTSRPPSSGQHSGISDGAESSSTAAFRPDPTLRTFSALSSEIRPGTKTSRGDMSVSSGSGSSSTTASDSRIRDFASSSRNGATSRMSAVSRGSDARRPTSAAGDGVLSPRKSPTKADFREIVARERAVVRNEFRDEEGEAKKCVVM